MRHCSILFHRFNMDRFASLCLFRIFMFLPNSYGKSKIAHWNFDFFNDSCGFPIDWLQLAAHYIKCHRLVANKIWIFYVLPQNSSRALDVLQLIHCRIFAWMIQQMWFSIYVDTFHQIEMISIAFKCAQSFDTNSF